MHVVLIGLDTHSGAHGAELRDVPDRSVLTGRLTQAAVLGGRAERVDGRVGEAGTASLARGEQVGVGVFVGEVVEQTVGLVLGVVVDDGADRLLLVGHGVVPHVAVDARRACAALPIGDVVDELVAKHLENDVGSLLVVLAGSGGVAGSVLEGSIPDEEFGHQSIVGRSHLIPVAVARRRDGRDVLRVDPCNPREVLVSRVALIARGEQREAALHDLGGLHPREDGGVVDILDGRDGVVEPHGLTVDFGQRHVGPHLDADGRGKETVEVVGLGHHLGIVGLEVEHVLEVVVAGDDDVIVARRVGVGVARQVVIVVVERDEFGNGLVRGFEHLATGVGQVDFLVAHGLHLGQDAQIARSHLRDGRHVVVARQGIGRLRLEEVVARSETAHRSHGEQHRHPGLHAIHSLFHISFLFQSSIFIFQPSIED